jgi:hypothetical protein
MSRRQVPNIGDEVLKKNFEQLLDLNGRKRKGLSVEEIKRCEQDSALASAAALVCCW